MKKWLKKFDRLTDGFLEGLKNVPLNLQNNKRLINKLIAFLLTSVCSLIAIIWVLITFIQKVAQVFIQNKEFIILAFVVICMIYSSILTAIDKRHDKKERLMADELKRREDEASLHYTHLRQFLFNILDERFCNIIEIVKPVSPNLLNAVKPLTNGDKKSIIYYNFKVFKLSTLPFSRGTDYVKNLLASHVIGKAQIDGIEGITTAIGDSLITPIYVDAVKDLGSTATIVLALDSEAYRNLMEIQGQTTRARELIEHI